MLIVLPFCSKDIHLARLNLELCRRQSRKLPHTLILAYDDKTDASGIAELAAHCFRDVETYRFEAWQGGSKWPQPQNHAWQSVARWIEHKGQPWFWWEPDATPLKAGWLDAIEAEYIRVKRPFLGPVVQWRGVPSPYMAGVAVYPPAVNQHTVDAFICRASPFDIIASREIMADVAPANRLIHHVAREKGWIENGGEEESPNFGNMDEVRGYPRDAVLFHPCKDGTLARLLIAACPELPVLEEPEKPTVDVQSTNRPKARRWKIYHVTERHKQELTREQRSLRAWQSWETLYRRGEMQPRHLWDYERSSAAIGDDRKLPYMKDVLREGLLAAKNDMDVIMLTNDDTILHEKTCDVLHDFMATRDAACSFRVNFDGEVPPLTLHPEEIVRLGKKDNDIGRDLFAFRKHWLRENWHRIPDMLLGELEWDLVLALLIRETHGFKTASNESRYDLVSVTELPKGYVLHKHHERAWNHADMLKMPGKKLNRQLSEEFYAREGYDFMVKK